MVLNGLNENPHRFFIFFLADDKSRADFANILMEKPACLSVCLSVCLSDSLFVVFDLLGFIQMVPGVDPTQFLAQTSMFL